MGRECLLGASPQSYTFNYVNIVLFLYQLASLTDHELHNVGQAWHRQKLSSLIDFNGHNIHAYIANYFEKVQIDLKYCSVNKMIFNECIITFILFIYLFIYLLNVH